MRTATATPALVADICLYGTHTTGAGYLGLIAPAAAPMLARDEAMFGTGEPVAGRSFTEAVFEAVTVLRERGVVAGVARIFAPGGERVAVVELSRTIPTFGDLGVAPGAGVSLRRAAAPHVNAGPQPARRALLRPDAYTYTDERGHEHRACHVCGVDCSTHPDAGSPLATCGDCGEATCPDHRDQDDPAQRCTVCTRLRAAEAAAARMPVLVWKATPTRPDQRRLVHVVLVANPLAAPAGRALCGATGGGEWAEVDGPETPTCPSCRRKAVR